MEKLLMPVPLDQPAPGGQESRCRSSGRTRRIYVLAPSLGIALLVFVFAPQLVSLASSPLLPLRRHVVLKDVRPGERILCEFLVANVSLRPLKVLSVSGGCDAMGRLSGSRCLRPFTVRTIVAATEVRKRARRVHREIVLEVDDARQPYYTFTLDATVTPSTPRPGATPEAALPSFARPAPHGLLEARG